ncbi:MAG: ATP-binding protein, partial [Chloroflexota bacterium]
TPWVEEKLFQLINHRYSTQLATVFTTNCDLASFDQRIQTRLTDSALSQVHYLEGGAGGDVQTLDSLDLPMLKRMTFQTFDPKFLAETPKELTDIQAIQRIAMKYAEEPQDWLVIAGQTGRGKTRLAAAIGNYCRASGQQVMFVVVPDLLDELRSAYNPQNPANFDTIFDRVRNMPLLILDDLGAQSGTAWADEKLFQLINHRYNASLPTVFTTNLKAAELDNRVLSRMTDLQISSIQLMGPFDFWGNTRAAVPDKPQRGRPRRQS